jgi:quercetin 2,3-dioxygenase
MLQKIDKSNFLNRGAINILYPGNALPGADTGIGSIGRIDHALISGNHLIAMHPHVNDEILSYFRTGKAEHKDSEGFVEIIGKNKLMLMKAGNLFYHEERMIDENEPLEGLQIFIRPGKKNLKPEVQFLDLEHLHSENKWRLLVSPTDETKFQFSSQTWLYDIKLLKNQEINLPVLAGEGLTCLLYAFKGKATINGNIDLVKKDSLLIRGEGVTITAAEDAELVLFVTDEEAEIFKNGMYSGNQK